MFFYIHSILFCLCVIVYGSHNSFNYSDLEALGSVACPERDKCEGYRNNLDYTLRSCECDFACSSYGDCCIDAFRRRNTGRTPPRSNLKCLPYGKQNHTGVYAISTCSSSWNGPREVREKCVGPIDLSDPLSAAPVTSVSQSLTYRNLFCAECNNADLASLETFQFGLVCDELSDLTEEQFIADITYNEQLGSWGIYRLHLNGSGSYFVKCAIVFDVPSYLNNSVRFCRSDIISTCAPDWTRQTVRRKCEYYMAVVYEIEGIVTAYKNPHCAICNHRRISDISCTVSGVHSRKRPMSFALLLDVNQSDGDQVGMRRVATPECPSGHKYDPFFKKCRLLVCALPGHVVVDGRCVRGG